MRKRKEAGARGGRSRAMRPANEKAPQTKPSAALKVPGIPASTTRRALRRRAFRCRWSCPSLLRAMLHRRSRTERQPCKVSLVPPNEVVATPASIPRRPGRVNRVRPPPRDEGCPGEDHAARYMKYDENSTMIERVCSMSASSCCVMLLVARHTCILLSSEYLLFATPSPLDFANCFFHLLS